MSLIETRKYKEALKAINPENSKAVVYKGSLLLSSFNLLSLISLSLVEFILLIQFSNTLALTYKSMGELGLAESLFLKAIEANPHSEDLLYQLGMVHYERDSTDSMIHFEKALGTFIQIHPAFFV